MFLSNLRAAMGGGILSLVIFGLLSQLVDHTTTPDEELTAVLVGFIISCQYLISIVPKGPET